METNTDGCYHNWKYVETETDCPTYHSRGEGQHNDPCYGSPCPCDGYYVTEHYQCGKCGKKDAIKK